MSELKNVPSDGGKLQFGQIKVASSDGMSSDIGQLIKDELGTRNAVLILVHPFLL